MNEQILADGSLAAIRHGLESRAGVRRIRRARHATGSQETGFCAAGAKYYTWQEELADAEAWAASLAPLDAKRRPRR